jgi:hypothetical protein
MGRGFQLLVDEKAQFALSAEEALGREYTGLSAY